MGAPSASKTQLQGFFTKDKPKEASAPILKAPQEKKSLLSQVPFFNKSDETQGTKVKKNTFYKAPKAKAKVVAKKAPQKKSAPKIQIVPKYKTLNLAQNRVVSTGSVNRKNSKPV